MAIHPGRRGTWLDQDTDAQAASDSVQPRPRPGPQASTTSASLDRWITILFDCTPLPATAMIEICDRAQAQLEKESTVEPVPTPVTVVGDIHGQFHDLVEIFRITGPPPDTNYLFLGDYVDRGSFSTETIAFLLALKARYPSRIVLMRGNHETRQITQIYGFFDEIQKKYNTLAVWQRIITVFDYLPLATIIDNLIFCPHGGLSPELLTLDSIRAIDRVGEVPPEGSVCDLLWSDPDERRGWGESPRGAGYTFGSDVAHAFLVRNKMELIARAHQLVMDGYQWAHGGKTLTLFSAPNYCYRCGNKAAVMELATASERSDDLFYQFDPAPLRGKLHSIFSRPEYLL